MREAIPFFVSSKITSKAVSHYNYKTKATGILYTDNARDVIKFLQKSIY